MINDFDWSILNFIQNYIRCDLLDIIIPKITALGNGGILWIITALVLVFKKKYRRTGIAVLAGLLLGVIFGNGLLKHLVARSRPCWVSDSVELLIANPTDYSFPSGHTLASFTTAFILLKADKRLGYPALAIAVLIAFSRLYLYVHYPTDVIGAVIIACAISFALIRIFKYNKNTAGKMNDALHE